MKPDSISFSVSYSLQEYLSIIEDHVLNDSRRKGLSKRDLYAYAFSAFLIFSLALVAYFAHAHAVAWLFNAAVAAAVLSIVASFPAMLRPVITVFGAPIFMLKTRHMPVCEFTIDNERIVRKSARGTYSKSWLDVIDVHAYTKGYIFQFKTGGIPIPYRCLNDEQAAWMQAAILRHIQA